MRAKVTHTNVLDGIVREDWGRLLAALISTLRDFQLAEDCLQDALTSALNHWPRGIPENPQGWLLQTARRKAIDRLRRRKSFDLKAPDLAMLMEMDRADSDDELAQDIPDERLRLIFTACHPALDQKTRLALTLRTLCGLTTNEIAHAFVDNPSAMAQRLVRAKQKISKANIPFKVPEPEDWGGRLDSILTVIYLIFNEGYSANDNGGDRKIDLLSEALRLANLLDQLREEEPETQGLLALMKLTLARAPAKSGSDGALIPLEFQNRELWDHGMAEEGRALLFKALRLGKPGPFQLQAAIAAIHSEAKSFAETGWKEIILIYDRLHEMTPNPVFRLNRAVALSYVASLRVALEEVDALEGALDKYQSFHAAKADLYRRSEEWGKAVYSYGMAIELCRNDGDLHFLNSRLDHAKKKAEQSSAQVQQGG